MKKIYISGPITDNRTGLPREGWEKDFQEAEEKLRDMGFEVINPTELTETAERHWKTLTVSSEESFGKDALAEWPEETPRWFYLQQCIYALAGEFACRHLVNNADDDSVLAGIYVIGHPDDIQRSYGTMTEINFALSANLPVFSQFYHGYQIDNLLRQITTKPTLAETSHGACPPPVSTATATTSRRAGWC